MLRLCCFFVFFFFNDTATTEIYTLSLHDALPICLLVRIRAVLTRPMIQLDETAYVRMAENLASGHGLRGMTGFNNTHFSPLVSFFITGIAAFLGDYVLSAFVVVAVFGSLVAVPTFLLGRELFCTRAGLMAAALVMVLPLMIEFSSRVYSESIYTFFLLMALYFSLRMLRQHRHINGLAAGLSLGTAYLGNPAAVYYFLAIAVLALVIMARRHRCLGKSLLLFNIGFMLFAAPYVVFLHSSLGKWTYSGKDLGPNIYASTHSLRHGTREWEADTMTLDEDAQLRQGVAGETTDPIRLLLRQPVQSIHNLILQLKILYFQEIARIVPLWLLPLLGLGLFAKPWRRSDLCSYGFLFLAMGASLSVLSTYVFYRLFTPYVPMAMIIFALGWLRLDEWVARETEWLGRRLRLSRWRWYVSALICVIVLLPPLYLAKIQLSLTTYPLSYKQAGEWLKDRFGPDAVIMSREYSSAYYAGGRQVLLPWSDYDRTTAYARDNGVDYLVIQSNEIDRKSVV